jgi:conjugal transfer pilus assembly protein TraV
MTRLNNYLMARASCLVVLVSTLGATGCAQLLTPLGAENYDCNRKENPASPYCHSFRAVADGTNAPIPDSRYDAAVKLEEADRMNGIAPAAPAGVDGAPKRPARPDDEAPVQRGLTAPIRPTGPILPPDGSPVRVAPLVQRTWIKRHVEQGDRLVGSTYLYKEVTRGHWQGFVEAPRRFGDFPRSRQAAPAVG